MSARKSLGNTLVLVIAALGVLVFLVAFFILNFQQLIGTHKQAQTAIDAAALQAAKDLGRVVITAKDGCHFGVVGLVDGAPKNNDVNNRSQIGINTVLATIRLDALIARELGNKTMAVLAAHDLELAKKDSVTLKNKIQSALSAGSAEDVNGKTFNIRENAEVAYDANAVRLGKGQRMGDLDLRLGYVNSPQVSSNVPVPNPSQLAQINGTNTIARNNTTYYQSYVPINTDIFGNQLTFGFVASADEPSLLHENEFSDNLGQAQLAFLAPSAVQVWAKEEVKPIAGDNTAKTEQMQVSATAVAGGRRLPHASGSLQVAFPGGPPPKGQGPDTTSVQSIMNHSMIELKNYQNAIETQGPTIDAADLGTDSKYTSWNSSSKGNWLTAKGGSVPASGSASLEASKFRGRENDDPSVVLSFLVYDWLHNMYLRPNINGVVTALSSELFPTGNTAKLDKNSNFGMQAAYASVEARYPVTFGLFHVTSNGEGDPRDLTRFTEDPNAYRRQFANVFGYVAADMTLPDASMVVAMNDQGQVVTTNGEPGEILFHFWNAISEMNELSGETVKAGKEVFDLKYEKVKAIEAKLQKMSEQMEKDRSLASQMAPEFCKLEEERDQNMFVLGRAMAAMLNGSSGVNVSLGMLNDRKAITALGVKKIDPLNYELAGGNFCPPSKAATKEEIMGTSVVGTGQAAAAPVRDWCTPPGTEGTAPILFFVRSKTAEKAGAQVGDSLLQPAFAAGSVPQHSLNLFVFSVNGDATQGGDGGSINKMNPNVAPFGVNVLNGQMLYQNLSSLIVKSPGSSLQEVWNCIARDNTANYTSDGAYFANQIAEGNNSSPAGQGYPPLAAEWTLRCPAPTETTSCVTKPFINLHSFATFDASAGADIQRVSMATDAAGNVSYSFDGQPMHFYTGNEWMDKVLYTNSFAPPGTSSAAKTDPAMKGGLYRGMVRRNTVQMSANTVDVVSNYTAADWEKYRSEHLMITNTNQYASYAHKGRTEKGDYLYSVYSQVVFYTLDQNSCPQLFRWSS
ncbi:MAG: hypothetical protein K2Y22_09625 [Candidatus Obscuribacterales bacterium]|nr:hypothetical protein [Candidatus Obscuribacterales bacterium]